MGGFFIYKSPPKPGEARKPQGKNSWPVLGAKVVANESEYQGRPWAVPAHYRADPHVTMGDYLASGAGVCHALEGGWKPLKLDRPTRRSVRTRKDGQQKRLRYPRERCGCNLSMRRQGRSCTIFERQRPARTLCRTTPS